MNLNRGFAPLLLYCAAVFGAAGAEKFEKIYEKYKALAYSLAFEILRDASLSEDAVSETFIRVYKNLHKIEEPESPKTAGFIAVIAKNCAKTIAKKSAMNSFTELMSEPADKFDLEQSAVDKITAEEIAEAAGALSEELRAVFLLKYAYDMSNKEIAKALGITAVNAGVLAHRAKKKLIGLVAENGGNKRKTR